MKAEIHPNYVDVTANCSCGNVIKTRSTLGKDLHVDVCSECHPFYTGKQKMVDTGGRIDRFTKRFGSRIAKKYNAAQSNAMGIIKNAESASSRRFCFSVLYFCRGSGRVPNRESQ